MKRLRYFDEQFLHAVDFNDAEDYHITMRRRHNRLLHTPGVGEGLVVTAVSATAVSVAPGTAIDASGRDIVLEDARAIDLGTLSPGAGAYIVIAYAEKPTDPSDETGTLDHTRWTEEPTIEGRAAPPPGPNEVLLAVVARAGQNVQGVDNSVRAQAGVREAATKVNRSGDRITGNLAIDGRLDVGGPAVAGSLRVMSGTIMPLNGNTPAAGIQFPSDPGGGGGDQAFIRYFAEAGETTKLLIGCENDPDDRISFHQFGAERLTIYAGNVGIGTTTPVHRLTVEGGIGATGDIIVGTGSNASLIARHVNGKTPGVDSPGGLHLNWDNGQPVYVGGGAPSALHVYGHTAIHGGDLNLDKDHTIRGGGGRLHIHSTERLYLLGIDNTHVSGAWGGPGHLFVDGSIFAAGRPVSDLQPGFGHGIFTWDLFCFGGAYGQTKSFLIDHPLDPENKHLLHGSLEGPEHGVYYRGEARLVDGVAKIELPHYFEALTREPGRTVTLTPKLENGRSPALLAASEVRDGRFEVRAVGAPGDGDAFFWEIKAARADVDELTIEVDKTPRSEDEQFNVIGAM